MLFKYEYEEGRVKKTKKMICQQYSRKFFKYFVLFLMRRRFERCVLGRPISLSFHTSRDDDETKARDDNKIKRE